MYWILNKENNTPAICGSVLKVANYTGININTLYNKFSRNKDKEYNNNTYRIVKL